MSGGKSCICKVKDKTKWRVLKRHYQCSAFNGYHPQYTSRSEVTCLVCGVRWRTEGGYVEELMDYDAHRDGPEDQRA